MLIPISLLPLTLEVKLLLFTACLVDPKVMKYATVGIWIINIWI